MNNFEIVDTMIQKLEEFLKANCYFPFVIEEDVNEKGDQSKYEWKRHHNGKLRLHLSNSQYKDVAISELRLEDKIKVIELIPVICSKGVELQSEMAKRAERAKDAATKFFDSQL